MFKHRFSEPVSLKTYIDWFLLSFTAGAVNAGGFLACQRFVSHVTGFATLAGVDAAAGDWKGAIGILTVPVYFLFGVMASALLIDRRIHEGQRPRYALVMGAVSVLLLLAGIGGFVGWFSTWGTPIILRQDYFFLALLCAASGLQNAALTSASGATIRTTHLTGITTDLGIGLVRAASCARDSVQWAQEMKANWLRVGTVTSFMVGSGIGGFIFLKVHYLGFLLPSAIAAYAMAVAIRDGHDRTGKAEGDAHRRLRRLPPPARPAINVTTKNTRKT